MADLYIDKLEVTPKLRNGRENVNYSATLVSTSNGGGLGNSGTSGSSGVSGTSGSSGVSGTNGTSGSSGVSGTSGSSGVSGTNGTSGSSGISGTSGSSGANGTSGSSGKNGTLFSGTTNHFIKFGTDGISGTNADSSESGSTVYMPGALNVTGNVTAAEFYRGSSKYKKHNIKEYIDDATNILLNTIIKDYNLNIDNSYGIGFLAEDTNPVLSGKYQNNHLIGNHLALLTKAIQELNYRLEKLENK